MNTNTNLKSALTILNTRKVDFIREKRGAEVAIMPAYGMGKEQNGQLEKLASRIEYVPTRRSTKRNPRTLPVYIFATA